MNGGGWPHPHVELEQDMREKVIFDVLDQIQPG